MYKRNRLPHTGYEKFNKVEKLSVCQQLTTSMRLQSIIWLKVEACSAKYMQNAFGKNETSDIFTENAVVIMA